MAASPDGRDDRGGPGKLPRNRARTIILLTILAVVVLLITFMLLVSQLGQ